MVLLAGCYREKGWTKSVATYSRDKKATLIEFNKKRRNNSFEIQVVDVDVPLNTLNSTIVQPTIVPYSTCPHSVKSSIDFTKHS